MIPLYSNASIRIGAAVIAFLFFCALAASMLRIDEHYIPRLRDHKFDDDQAKIVDFHPPPPLDFLPPPQPTVSQPPPPADPDPVPTPRLQDVHNATLGFQKIFVLSMPNRRDKRDVAALAAYYTGLDIEFIDGVPGADVSIKERPDGWAHTFNKDKNIEGSLGCWRGHMDIYRKMVLERIQTAFVIEDDADWDVMIKEQMIEVAKGSQYVTSQGDDPPQSPYGDNWWYISTGHCSIGANINRDQKHWVINGDPTVVDEKHRNMFFFGPKTTPKDISGPNKRLLFSLNRFMCTGSYGISLRGATRIIYDQEVQLHGETIDMAISKLCDTQGKGKCVGVYPSLTGIYIAAGDSSRGSDRANETEGKGRNEERASRLLYSTRLNLGSLVDGKTMVKPQYPNNSMLGEIDASTFKMPEGQPLVITKEMYKGEGA